MRESEGLLEIHQPPPPPPLLLLPLRTPQQLQPPPPVLLPLSVAQQVQPPLAVMLSPPRQQIQQWFRRISPSCNLVLPAHHQQRLKMFWQNELRQIQEAEYTKSSQQLPIARIKKVMKSDETVNMISSEVPILFIKACELFICDLTLRAWLHTEDNNHRTLQRLDISSGITRTDVYDFLVDIVPRNRDVRINDFLSTAESSNVNSSNDIYDDDSHTINTLDEQEEVVELNDNADNGVTIAYLGSDNGVTIAYPGPDNDVTIAYPGVGIADVNARASSSIMVARRMYQFPYQRLMVQGTSWTLSTYLPVYLLATLRTDPGEDDKQA